MSFFRIYSKKRENIHYSDGDVVAVLDTCFYWTGAFTNLFWFFGNQFNENRFRHNAMLLRLVIVTLYVALSSLFNSFTVLFVLGGFINLRIYEWMLLHNGYFDVTTIQAICSEDAVAKYISTQSRSSN